MADETKKVVRINSEQFEEARLGYVAALADQGESEATIRAALDARIGDLCREITIRDTSAAEAEFILGHAQRLYEEYRRNCQKSSCIPRWSLCKEHVKGRWMEIARTSIRIIKDKLGAAPCCPWEPPR